MKHLSLGLQQNLAREADDQRAFAPVAARAIEDGLVGASYPEIIQEHAVEVLQAYANGQVSPGFENVPLYTRLGQHVLPDNIVAASSLRVEVQGIAHANGQRPMHGPNAANQLLFGALLGIDPSEDLVHMNNASESNHGVFVNDPSGLVRVGQRLLPLDGQEGREGKYTSDVLMVGPDVKKGLYTVCADNPVGIFSIGDRIGLINGAWPNLSVGADLAMGRMLREMGLLGRYPLRTAIGPSAEFGFELPKAAIHERNKVRQVVTGDPDAPYHYQDYIDPHETDPKKVELRLRGWLAGAVRDLTHADDPMNEVVVSEICTVRDAHPDWVDKDDKGEPGIVHGSRRNRPEDLPTEKGQMAGGDRIAIMGVDAFNQRPYYRDYYGT